MKQDDLDKLTKRVNAILRDSMLPPDADYKLILIIAERDDEDNANIKLSLGTTAEPGVAAYLCDMAAHEYSEMHAASVDVDRLGEAVHRVIEMLLARARQATEEEVPASVTKH